MGERPAPRSYKVSQHKRRRVEEIFGYLKIVGSMRKTRFIGKVKTQIAAYLSAAYNLLWIAKLQSAGRAAGRGPESGANPFPDHSMASKQDEKFNSGSDVMRSSIARNNSGAGHRSFTSAY